MNSLYSKTVGQSSPGDKFSLRPLVAVSGVRRSTSKGLARLSVIFRATKSASGRFSLLLGPERQLTLEIDLFRQCFGTPKNDSEISSISKGMSAPETNEHLLSAETISFWGVPETTVFRCGRVVPGGPMGFRSRLVVSGTSRNLLFLGR
jgi:hypothetical protein